MSASFRIAVCVANGFSMPLLHLNNEKTLSAANKRAAVFVAWKTLFSFIPGFLMDQPNTTQHAKA